MDKEFVLTGVMTSLWLYDLITGKNLSNIIFLKSLYIIAVHLSLLFIHILKNGKPMGPGGPGGGGNIFLLARSNM